MASKVLPALSEYSVHLEQFKSHLLSYLPDFEENVRPLVDYALRNTGKCFRPLLTFMSARDLDENMDRVLPVAAIVEMVHCATLVHDDILDDSSFRRNVATAKEVFGPNNAVLLGDALFSHAIYLSTELPMGNLAGKVARSTRRVCAGEIKQTLMRDPEAYTLEKYFEVIELKTAELFALACYLGAVATSEDEAYVKGMEDFGYNLGMAYQVYDDLADLVQPVEELGKTPGLDVEDHILSLPMMLILESKSEEERKVWLEDYFADKFDLAGILEQMEGARVRARVDEIFGKYLSQAREALGSCKGSPAESLADMLQAKMDLL